MSYLKVKIAGVPSVNIYPLSCLHVGARQSDVKFIREHIERIKGDPLARWVYLGDGGECVTMLSKGNVYEQLYSPQTQLDILVQLLAPIRDKGLLVIRGNHGGRIFKESGLSFDKNLALQLKLPYMGVEAYLNLIVNRSRFDLFMHHGVDAGVSLQSKTNKAELFSRFIDADAIFTAHSHVGLELTPAALKYMDNYACKVKIKLRYQYICGSGYDSRTGYAQQKGYTPLLPQFIMVEFLGKMKTGGYIAHEQRYHRWHSDGQHDVDGVYLARQPQAEFGEDD